MDGEAEQIGSELEDKSEHISKTTKQKKINVGEEYKIEAHGYRG